MYVHIGFKLSYLLSFMTICHQKHFHMNIDFAMQRPCDLIIHICNMTLKTKPSLLLQNFTAILILNFKRHFKSWPPFLKNDQRHSRSVKPKLKILNKIWIFCNVSNLSQGNLISRMPTQNLSSQNYDFQNPSKLIKLKYYVNI